MRESAQTGHQTMPNGASDKPLEQSYHQPQAPAIALPRGGGAIRGIGEKFAANPVTGTGLTTIPIAVSDGRAGFGPQLSLAYDSGASNGPFGFGWNLALPAITRKTDQGLPQYRDAEDSDGFVLSGAEDLVPVFKRDAGGDWVRDAGGNPVIDDGERDGYTVRRYQPRIEGLFARIERWTRRSDGDVHWRSISKDNSLTLYGKDSSSRIADPDAPQHIFSWLICETRDDKGNAIIYTYKAEDETGIDHSLAHERNRGVGAFPKRTANRYIKRISYGNRLPLLDAAGKRPRFLTQAQIDGAGWMFEAIFDYGEHDPDDPRPGDTGAWLCRSDPFSSYRAGFEIRTYRLCRRVLMFHHFPGEAGVGQDCLVRSTALAYRETSIATFVTSVTQSGYKRAAGGGYLKQSLPPLEFEYSEAVIGQDIHEVDPGGGANLPYGVDGAAYQWVDLDGEGLAGALTEQGGEWFYKRNESALTRDAATEAYAARLAPVEQVGRRPSSSLGGQWQFLDLAGDGQVDLVKLDRPVSGFYERTGDQDWEPFRAFQSIPNLAWNDPNLKFIDLTGDGHADVLLAEDQVYTWYPALAEAGFGPATLVAMPADEERGPRVIFADGSQTLFLADMSGDGLIDIVRIHNGEVCYWPNLGYGRFGAKIAMDCAPWFDTPDQFDPRRLRLADIDGSGVTDIIYLGRGRTRFWFNQSGNSWSAATDLPGFPPVDNVASVAAVDLLGNGTACLVWSSPLPGAARAPMKYLNLMAAGKPHLLVGTRNNLGAETRIRYAPSTYFYLRDKYEGRPWITRLPFPVHVVERVETFDYISRNRFVTRYAYHHGYFDGAEREFRGFGMVEQWDTEVWAALSQSDLFPVGDNIEAASHTPPVYTRTWFHTGVFLGRERVSTLFAGLGDQRDHGEYYREPAWRDNDAEARRRLLDDTVLPAGLSPEEEREACRALKGMMLRQEVYALDGSDQAGHPYTVVEQNFTIRLVQPRGGNPHAIFFTHAREAITYHYDRNPADPRTGHTLTLEVDGFGNVLKQVAAGYGRRPGQSPLAGEDRQKQERTLLTYTENDVTNPIDEPASYPDDYHAPLPAETRTYEVTGFAPAAAALRFSFEDFAGNQFQPVLGLPTLGYEQTPNFTQPQKRLIERVRSLYRSDTLAGLLGPRVLEPLALPGESYRLAFSPGLLAQVYTRGGQPLLPANPAAVLAGGGAGSGGYVDLDGDGSWWIPAGRVFLSRNGSDTPAQELAYARSHFFLPQRFRDPFHTGAASTETIITFDAYDLLMLETRDALGNRVTVGERLPNGTIDPSRPGNDYRVLQPWRVMDQNRNRTLVAFDALGLVVGQAVMGKPEESLGDSLDGFPADLAEAAILDYFANPPAALPALLGRATTRMLYDLFAYQRTKDQASPQPAVVATLAREIHDSDSGGQPVRIQHSLTYSDGFGRAIQTKIQAEPGPAPRRDANGAIIIGPDGRPELTPHDVNPRWVGSGWTVFNNKGRPVRQYEPFFSDTHRFEFNVRAGVSSILFYDPVERVVATLQPNHTYEKVVFDPWLQVSYDANDTSAAHGSETGDPRTDPDIAGYVAGYFATQPAWQTWYAQRRGGALGAQEQAATLKAAAHAGTPTMMHFDTLGRGFLTVAHNRFERNGTTVDETYATRVELDIEGNQRAVRDAIVQNGDGLGRIIMRYDYDMLGNRIHEAGMEAGEHWMLNDVSGQAIRAWDSRGHTFRTEYDPLRRPLRAFVTGADPANPTLELLTERLVYGEQHPEDEARNLRGTLYLHLDQAGIAGSEAHDFQGNLLRSTRRLAREYRLALDWRVIDTNHAALPADAAAKLNPTALEAALAPLLEPDTFTSRSTYDALSRPVTHTTPDNSVIRPTYNEANLLERVEANLRGVQQNGQPVWTQFVADIDYDAQGRRTFIDYGNGVRTTYTYDPLTFRLVHLLTRRNAAGFPNDCPDPPPAGWPGCQVQNLRYTYDPAGNITHIRDDAQQTVYFRNRRVEPSAEYTYDAIYRLIEATGREHLGQAGGAPIPHSYNDAPRTRVPHPGDGNALGSYVERYIYDAVGNFQELNHRGSDPAHPGWTRTYAYNEPSLLEPGKQSNRLTSTTTGATTETYSTGANGYDAHGNLLRMPQLQVMQWDFKNQLRMTRRQAVNSGDGEGVQRQGERTYYVYDAGGQRVRKVTELSTGQLKDERIYLDGCEIYRRHGANTLTRETLHLMDDKQRIVLVETRTQGSEPGVPAQLTRYQFGNHLGSAALELDDQAQIISYEEYTPYGSTAYQAVRSQTETPRRYRYTGKERDEESGLYYHGARYYAAWLGRWLNPDPVGLGDGPNLYHYVNANPIRMLDPSGLSEEDFGNLNDVVKDLNKSKLKVNLTDTRSHAEPTARPMGRRKARKYADKQAADYRKTAGLQGADVQAGHTAAARHARRSRISEADWDRQQFQELHSRKGRGLDVTVTDQKGKRKVTTRHRSQEGLIDDAVERTEKANGKKLTPQGQLDAAEEVRWRTENLPMDQRDVERLRNSGRAAPEKGPPVDPKTGRVISKEAKLAQAGGEALQKAGKGAKALLKLAKAGRLLLAAVPILGAAAGHASAAHAATQGDYTSAALDEAGNIPVAGDLLDAGRAGYAFGEALDEGLGIGEVAAEHGERFENAAKSLGLGEDAARLVGATGAALSSITVSPTIAAARMVRGWFD